LKRNDRNFLSLNGLGTREIIRGPRGQNSPACPNFTLCPNDFSLGLVKIPADSASIGVAFQIEF